MLDKLPAGTTTLSPLSLQPPSDIESRARIRCEAARHYPVGAEVLSGRDTLFRVWAPGRRRVEVVLEGPTEGTFELNAEVGGYVAGFSEVGEGTRYRFRLDGEKTLYPDPVSRFQPDGPHGPSQVVDPSRFAWSDQGWRGIGREGQVIYEMHIGTFTPEGTWGAAARELPELA